MKFHKEHEAAILKAFVKNGMTKDDFHFIKRKGRIITQHRHSNQNFSYYLKKEVELDEDTGGFEEIAYFEVKVNGERSENKESWKKVMAEYERWLNSLIDA